MAKKNKPVELGAAIERELTIYSKDVEARIEEVTKAAMSKLVRQTKATAPVGKRGKFRRSIAGKKLDIPRGSAYLWHVKAPEYRLTHLLVHGHATRNGGRTRADPFLQNALNAILPEYEEKLKEAVKNDS